MIAYGLRTWPILNTYGNVTRGNGIHCETRTSATGTDIEIRGWRFMDYLTNSWFVDIRLASPSRRSTWASRLRWVNARQDRFAKIIFRLTSRGTPTAFPSIPKRTIYGVWLNQTWQKSKYNFKLILKTLIYAHFN